ncbi:MAG: cytidylate kinase family protein [Candidatus Diapherotrites archaeon]|nr:cytidylate kinase family protein [Candidatus Diapherotrites archaeon]
MIITIGGLHCAGRSTVAKLLSEKTGFRHVSVGDVARKMAMEKGMSIEEFNTYLEKHLEEDKELDRRMLAEASGDVILEGNLCGALLPKADIKIWLTADPRTRAERRMIKQRFGDKPSGSIEDAEKELKQREESERKRYEKMYGINLSDLSAYDLIINTGEWPAKSVASIILEAVERRNE